MLWGIWAFILALSPPWEGGEEAENQEKQLVQTGRGFDREAVDWALIRVWSGSLGLCWEKFSVPMHIHTHFVPNWFFQCVCVCVCVCGVSAVWYMWLMTKVAAGRNGGRAGWVGWVSSFERISVISLVSDKPL